MKKAIVLIDNNLEHDNRVKRHVTTLLNLGHEVTVIAAPIPSAVPGLAHDRLKVIFWPPPDYTAEPHIVRRLAQAAGVAGYVFQAFPAAFAAHANAPRLAPVSEQIQARQLGCSWWAPFRGHISKAGTNPDDDRRATLVYFEHMLSWACFTRRHEADLIYCNDLPSLLAGVAHKLRYKSRLVYDAHEIYYDMAPGAHSRLWKESMALLEMHLAGQADSVIGVSESHAEWMRRTYTLAPAVRCVPNVFGMGQEVGPPPPRAVQLPLRVYYHGASDQWRGLDNLTRAIALVPDAQLVLRCYPSPTLEGVKALAADLGVADRVKVLPLVKPDQMIEAIRAEADVGIHACEPPTALNIKVGLSNKFIEYLMAGIPIITAPLDEQARIVREYELGCVLPDNSPAEIARALRWMIDRRAEMPAMGARAYQAANRRFSWKTIRQTLETALAG